MYLGVSKARMCALAIIFARSAGINKLDWCNVSIITDAGFYLIQIFRVILIGQQIKTLPESTIDRQNHVIIILRPRVILWMTILFLAIHHLALLSADS